MTRRLPWQNPVAEGSSSRKSRETKKSTLPLVKIVAPESEVDSDDTIIDESRTKKTLYEREPSSSPPLVALEQPPSVEFMKEGLDGDDRWIMVEDEFMSTAQSFTRHLHQAEYDRQKQLAKKRNTSAISNITSPSQHGLSNETGIRRTSKALDKMQADLLGPASDDTDSGDDPWAGNPHLASLVSQVRHPSAKLSQLANIKSNTKASLGFVKQQRNYQDHSEEQVSKSHPQRTSDRAQLSHQSFSGSSDGRNHATSDTHESNACEYSAPTGDKRSDVKMEEAAEDMRTPLPVLKSPSTAAPRHFSERMARRRQNLTKLNKDEEEAISMDQVPTFLI